MSNTKSDLAGNLQQLEELLAWFEQEDLDIAEALKKYEQGNKLVAALREQLNDIENKIDVLDKRFDN